MLIVGGVHQTEVEAINLTQNLLGALQKSAEAGNKPFYNIIFVPNLFGDRTANKERRSREYEGVDTNRNFPAANESLAHAATVGNGVPVDAFVDKKRDRKRKILPENVILLKLIEKYTPSRSLSIHDHSPQDVRVVSQGEASATVDMTAGGAPMADLITSETVRRAYYAGISVKGNIITKEMALAA